MSEDCPSGSMISLVLLIAGNLLAAPPGGVRAIPLRLESGQEFIYQVRYSQESDRPGLSLFRFLKSYVLILEPGPPAKAAFMTIQLVEPKPGAESIPVVRLEFGRIDALGRVTLDSTSNLPRLPIDGPPTLETLPFVELPAKEFPMGGNAWQVPDSELGPQIWRLLKYEGIELGRSFKMKGEQSSGDWNLAGQLVWKRQEFATLLIREGIVSHVERLTEWRTPGGERFHSTCVVDLDSIPAGLPPGQFEDRRLEIRDAIGFSRDLAELVKPERRTRHSRLRLLDRTD